MTDYSIVLWDGGKLHITKQESGYKPDETFSHVGDVHVFSERFVCGFVHPKHHR